MDYNKKQDVNESFRVIKLNQSNKGLESEEINVSSIKFEDNKKSIVVLCGNNTKSSMRAYAYANYCLRWLDKNINKNDVAVYAIFYPKDQPLLQSLEPNPDFDYNALANLIVNQILYKKNKLQTVDEMCKKISDITFFGHSMGGYVMNELARNFISIMEQEGGSKKSINRVLSNIVFIGYSPFRLVKYPIKSVYVTPIYDTMGSVRLVDKMMQEKGDFIASKSNIKNLKISEIKEKFYGELIEHYINQIGNDLSIYYKNQNTLISTPNLLFNFEQSKEDHNLAGIIEYQKDVPYKTKAGKITTKLMKDVFSYCLQRKRDNFSVDELYESAVERLNKEKDLEDINEEL